MLLYFANCQNMSKWFVWHLKREILIFGLECRNLLPSFSSNKVEYSHALPTRWRGDVFLDNTSVSCILPRIRNLLKIQLNFRVPFKFIPIAKNSCPWILFSLTELLPFWFVMYRQNLNYFLLFLLFYLMWWLWRSNYLGNHSLFLVLSSHYCHLCLQ